MHNSCMQKMTYHLLLMLLQIACHHGPQDSVLAVALAMTLGFPPVNQTPIVFLDCDRTPRRAGSIERKQSNASFHVASKDK